MSIPAVIRPRCGVPDPEDAEHLTAGERAVGTIYAVLRGYGLDGDAAVDATRALRSALHGFVTLEASGGFGLPQDIARSYDQLVAAMDVALRDGRDRPRRAEAAAWLIAAADHSQLPATGDHHAVADGRGAPASTRTSAMI